MHNVIFTTILLFEITLRDCNRSSLYWISFNESISINLSLCWSSKSDQNLWLKLYSYNRHLMISISEMTFGDYKRSLLLLDRSRLSESVSMNLSLCPSSKSDRIFWLHFYYARRLMISLSEITLRDCKRSLSL